MVFNPGAITPRRAPPIVHLAPDMARAGITTASGPAPEATPSALPASATFLPTDSAAPSSPATTSSKLPVYLAVGGVVVLGGLFLLMRK